MLGSTSSAIVDEVPVKAIGCPKAEDLALNLKLLSLESLEFRFPANEPPQVLADQGA